MFSAGSGSHDGTNYPTQWALNPSAYQNVANDQVDWAALAQQWIMMKETVPPDQMPQAPPPPSIAGKKEVVDEGGEAPMDVENDKDDSEWTDNGSGSQDWNWQQQWGWNSNWNGPNAVPPPNSVNNSKSALLPTPYSHYSHQNVESNTNLEFQNVSTNDYNSGYWTNNSSSGRSKGVGKQRVPRKGSTQERVETSTESVTLDAAKRRQLPAWIREGLEKMEREKQKQLEKERERIERENYLSRKKEETEGAIKLLQSSGLPEKSKFDSDSEEERAHSSRKSSPRRRTPPISEEEKSEQTMLLVRRTMTQVLLQVTSAEIQAICEEELARFRDRKTASAKKTAPYGTPSQGSISGTLGLGMYGGESDSSSDESSSDRQQNSVNNDSSDTQLKETIRRRKAEYSKTEREIERRLSKHEERREHGNDKSDGGQTPEWPDSGGERVNSQVDAHIHGSGSQKTRRYSQKSSSRTPPRKDKKSSPDSRDGRKRQSKKSKRSSSSRESESDSDESTNSESSSSMSSRDRTKSHRRSRSIETDRSEKARKKQLHSRSESLNSDSDDRSHSSRRRYERSDSKRSDRSRRERDRRSRSKSRHRHTRSRSRERTHRSKRSRSRSRSSRRSKRSRSRSHTRRGHRSPHGGKRSRR